MNNAVSSSLSDSYSAYNIGMISRLDGFYGKVDARMNYRIKKWILGNRVLDIGCGFGQLVYYLQGCGYQAIGIDLLKEFINSGKQRYPESDLRVSYGDLDFPDQSIDTVILKDTIHHIFQVSDIDTFFIQLKRVCVHRVIIMDPNPSIFLIAARHIIKHFDPICSPQNALQICEKHGIRLINIDYYDTIAFPLNGGFISREFIHNERLGRALLKLDEWIENLTRKFHIIQLIGWRYFIVGELG